MSLVFETSLNNLKNFMKLLVLLLSFLQMFSALNLSLVRFLMLSLNQGTHYLLLITLIFLGANLSRVSRKILLKLETSWSHEP